MTDSVMIVRLPFILFWLLTSTCVIGAKQHGIKDVGPQLPALVSYKIIHKAFNDESSTVYLAQTHDLHTSADQKHLSNSAEFNKIAAKQSPIPFLAYCVATNKIVGVKTPYGLASQADNATALAARGQVEGGATLYRTGTMGKSAAGEAQFWSLESPFSPGFAQRYGIPVENVLKADFIETATLKPGTSFITRPAPGIGNNLGGGIEVVVPSGGVNLNTFSTGPF